MSQEWHRRTWTQAISTLTALMRRTKSTARSPRLRQCLQPPREQLQDRLVVVLQPTSPRSALAAGVPHQTLLPHANGGPLIARRRRRKTPLRQQWPSLVPNPDLLHGPCHRQRMTTATILIACRLSVVLEEAAGGSSETTRTTIPKKFLPAHRPHLLLQHHESHQGQSQQISDPTLTCSTPHRSHPCVLCRTTTQPCQTTTQRPHNNLRLLLQPRHESSPLVLRRHAENSQVVLQHRPENNQLVLQHRPENKPLLLPRLRKPLHLSILPRRCEIPWHLRVHRHRHRPKINPKNTVQIIDNFHASVQLHRLRKCRVVLLLYRPHHCLAPRPRRMQWLQVLRRRLKSRLVASRAPSTLR